MSDAAQELFSAQELQEKFSLDRITKSAAVFDKTKLSWMNGQYLRALPDEEVGLPLIKPYCCLLLRDHCIQSKPRVWSERFASEEAV